MSRFWPDSLPGQALLLCAMGFLVMTGLNLWLLRQINENYLAQTLRDRVNLAASRLLLVNARDREARLRAIADLDRYSGDSWSVAHLLLDRAPRLPLIETEREKEIRKALQERLQLKGFQPSEILVHIYDGASKATAPQHAGQLLEQIDPARKPLLELGMRLEDGSWFSIFQSLQFDFVNIFRIQLIQLAFYLALCALCFLILFKFFLYPLASLARNMEAFGRNPDAQQHFGAEGSRELRQVAKALNLMRSRIRENLDRRNLMLAALAHDLRTPLARIRLRSESLADDRTASALLKDCGEIEKLARQSLELVKSLQSEEKQVLLDMPSFVESLVEDYRMAGRELPCALPEKSLLPVLTRPACLRSCLANLLDNAFKYAGNARISLKQDANGTILEVQDHGPGIPEAELENALKPFWQLDKSRKKGGSGLGLSIACNMARLAGARLSLHPATDGGLCARVIFS